MDDSMMEADREERRRQQEAQFWKSEALAIFSHTVDVPALAKDPTEKPHGPAWFAQTELLRHRGFAQDNASKVLRTPNTLRTVVNKRAGGI